MSRRVSREVSYDRIESQRGREMPGKKITRARTAELEEMGEEKVFATYLEHGSVKRTVEALWQQDDESPSHIPLYNWLHEDPERWERWKKVRQLRGHVEGDMAYEVAMSATEQDVRSKKLQVDTLKWRAAVLSPKDFSTQPTQQVTVNVAAEWVRGMIEADSIQAAEIVEEETTQSSGDDDWPHLVTKEEER